MKKVYSVFVIAWAYLHAALAAICDKETIQYKLGRITTLININSEDIFHLPGACNKQINIVGAVRSAIYVAEVGFSKDRFFKYEGTQIQPKFYSDRMFLRNGECPRKKTHSDSYWMEIKNKGLIHLNDTNSVCFKFVPNKRNLNLGGHIPGTSIRLLVNVEAAECDTLYGHRARSGDGRQYLSSDCKDICTASGFLKRCTTPVSRSPAPTVLVHPATRPTHTNLLTPRTMPSAYTTQPFSQQHMTSTSESVTFSSTKTRSSTTDGTRYIDTRTTSIVAPITSDQTSLPTLRPSTVPKTTSDVPISTQAMTTGRKHVDTVTDTSAYNSPSTSGMNTRRPGKTSGDIPASTAKAITPTSTNIGAHPSDPSTDEITTTTGGSTLNTTKSAIGAEGQNTETLFGLVEGLYVVAGCTLGILVIVFLGCCLHHRHKMCINQGTYTDYNTTTTSKSDTPAGHADIPWRDNWLVRHHGNNAITIGNGYSSQSDGELSPIHGRFFNQSNQELHLIHTDNQFVYPDVPNRQDELPVLEYEDDENPYDNPWPDYLVKLSKGDIVLANRGIERASSINTHTTESSEGRRRFRTESVASADTCMCRHVQERCNMSPTCGRFYYRKRDTRQGPLAVRPKRYHVHRHESTVSLQHEPNIDYPRRKRTVSEPTQAASTKTVSSQTANANNRDTNQNDGNVPNIKERSDITQTVREANSNENKSDEMQLSASRVHKKPINNNETVQPESTTLNENRENPTPTDDDIIQKKSPTLKPNATDKDQHERAKYAFVSKLHGAVGTMQFKK